MQETNTVQQLNQALNQLLDAYDKLKYENKQLNEKNEVLEDELSQLKDEKINIEEEKNDIESQMSSLSDTTKHNSSEIDTMLGRIKSILNTNENIDTNTELEEVEDVINSEIYNQSTLELTQSTQDIKEVQVNTEKEKETITEEPNENKEIDLGRMQSLLNGFNK